MGTTTNPPPVTSDPESRLDRIARDVSRTLLHGSRTQDTKGNVTPSTIATGQQVQVDVPPIGPVNFRFSAGDSTSPVTVSHDQAVNSAAFMSAALGPDSAKYLSLTLDPDIPNWIFQQRQFTVQNPPAVGDEIAVAIPNLASPPATISLTAVKLPKGALQEPDDGDRVASLLTYDNSTKSLDLLPAANWQPAIVIRFPLTKCTPSEKFPAGSQVFEVGGAPQGDRWFLDQLGLLSAVIPGLAVANLPLPTIAGISLSLETIDSSGTPSDTIISDWTIARTNLTREARAANRALEFGFTAFPPPAQPYVALSSVSPDQDKDAIRLLEMASITNSGGYFLSATTNLSDAHTLVLTVVLASQLDPDANNQESIFLPLAANAVALSSGSPDAIRFNGIGHVQIAPFVPPGSLAFGWTRTEPTVKTTDEDRFGFGTISLVEYSAMDATGQFLATADSVIAISPNPSMPADHFERSLPSANAGLTSGPHNLHSGSSAAMRLTSRRAKVSASDPPVSVVNHYRSTLPCFSGSDSPWKRLSDPRQSQITITPSFRDVFGNRFPAVLDAPILRRLFYTDPLISPGEWPGVRLTLYPTSQSGQPALALEMSYRFLAPDQDKTGRLQRLRDICTQLNGASNDVTISCTAPPLLPSAVKLDSAAMSATLLAWCGQEVRNTTTSPAPVNVLVMQLGTFKCDAQITGLLQFQPVITISRTNGTYCPQSSDLPKDPVLNRLIQCQVTTATAPFILQATSTLPATVSEVSASPSGRQDEFAAVAAQFQHFIAGPLNLQAGFLRNKNNQHELWFIPNNFFPSAPDPATYAGWSFATPRPLNNTLGAESFQAPNFAATCAGAVSCWNDYPLIGQTLVDQDFDQLGRIAMDLIETETSDLTVLMQRENADLMRSLLATREQIANQLAVFAPSENPGWLVPLFATPGDLDPAAISRIATDAFLDDLTNFYRVSTILQLPLAVPGNTAILTFEGSVSATFDSAVPTMPAFSGVLVSGGDHKITVLYDLPPGVIDPDSIPAIDSFSVTFSYVQLPFPGSSRGANPFSQGAWLQLAQPFQLKWKGYPDSIPVADRVFPSTPVIQSAAPLMPWIDQNGKPPLINAVNVSLLAQWGWSFSLGLSGATSDDTVHIVVTYNSASDDAPQALRSRAAPGWQPETLLQSLYVLKLLNDNWHAMPATGGNSRLNVLNLLATFFADFLSTSALGDLSVAQLSTASLPTDFFTLTYPQTTVSGDQRQIMKGAINVSPWTNAGTLDVTTLTATAEAPNNSAFLIGSNPTRNFKIALQLFRNQFFGPQDSSHAADSRLIYTCAPVEFPLDIWPQNLWSPPVPSLHFDMTGRTLQTALAAFFEGILNQTILSSINLDIGISLFWTKGNLSVVTPFCIIPSDSVPPADGTAGVAPIVFAKCQDLLGVAATRPPEAASAAVRLRVKITAPSLSGQQSPGRTLIEIASIDFQL